MEIPTLQCLKRVLKEGIFLLRSLVAYLFSCGFGSAFLANAQSKDNTFFLSNVRTVKK